jgi:hypothetical protein
LGRTHRPGKDRKQDWPGRSGQSLSCPFFAAGSVRLGATVTAVRLHTPLSVRFLVLPGTLSGHSFA